MPTASIGSGISLLQVVSSVPLPPTDVTLGFTLPAPMVTWATSVSIVNVQFNLSGTTSFAFHQFTFSSYVQWDTRDMYN